MTMPALFLMLLLAVQGGTDPKAKLEAAAGPLPLPRGIRYVPDCSRKLSDAQGVPVAVFTFGAKASASQHALLHGQTPKNKTVALNVADAAEKKTLAPARAYYERKKWKEQQPGSGIYEASDDSWVARNSIAFLCNSGFDCPRATWINVCRASWESLCASTNRACSFSRDELFEDRNFCRIGRARFGSLFIKLLSASSLVSSSFCS